MVTNQLLSIDVVYPKCPYLPKRLSWCHDAGWKSSQGRAPKDYCDDGCKVGDMKAMICFLHIEIEY